MLPVKYILARFVKVWHRFDANSYLYITKAIDRFDLTNGSSLEKIFKAASSVRFLIIAFKSDWLYPAYQSKEIVKACKQAQIDVSLMMLAKATFSVYLKQAQKEAQLKSY
jgi:homoserine O-acetyltransferase